LEEERDVALPRGGALGVDLRRVDLGDVRLQPLLAGEQGAHASPQLRFWAPMGGARPPLLLGALRGTSGLILRSEGHRYQYRPARGLGIGCKARAKRSESEWKAFLVEKPRTGKLGTVRKDGRPHVAPIWFALDDDGTILFMTGVGPSGGAPSQELGGAAPASSALRA